MFLSALWSLRLPELTTAHHGHHQPTPKAGFDRYIVGLLFLAAIWFMAFSPALIFFNPYLARFGYSGTLTGLYWAIGIGTEIIVFWFMQPLAKRFRPRTLIIAATLVSCSRWFVMAAYPTAKLLVAIAQLANAATISVFLSVSMVQLYERFGTARQARAQAWFNSAAGVGAALGALIASLLWEQHPQAIYAMCGGVTLLSLGFVWAYDQRPAAAASASPAGLSVSSGRTTPQ